VSLEWYGVIGVSIVVFMLVLLYIDRPRPK
jgi:hypothetical protein